MNGYVLDSDSASNYLDMRRAQSILRERILSEPAENIFISIITVEEMLRGELALVQQQRKPPVNPPRLITAYAKLDYVVASLMRFQVLPYDEAAQAEFERIPENIRRRHPQDCRIAAIALARRYTVVTSNLRDFAGIPGLNCEDWTRDGDDAENG